MTAVMPEETVELANALVTLPDAEPKLRAVLETGLLRAARLTGPSADYTASIDTGLTESYAAFDARMNAREARDA